LSFEILPALTAHSAELLERHIKTCAEHAANFPGIFDTAASSTTMAGFLRKSFHVKGREGVADNIFVAIAGDEMVGYIMLAGDTGHNSQDKTLVGMMVYDIWVRPRDRQTGVAQALLDHATAAYRAKGHAHFRATVWGGNTASRGVFEACGFTEVYRVYEKTQDPDAATLRAKEPARPAPWWQFWR
jgi:ribosomal protein S18 acetylase RimI-like enzyme